MARSRGGEELPVARADFVRQVLDDRGEKIVKNGETLVTPGDKLIELTMQAIKFAEERLPILKAAEIA